MENSFKIISDKVSSCATTKDRFRISPEPFKLSRSEHKTLKDLGVWLLAFYKAVNKLYFQSVKGQAPEWICRYLDLGKPASLVKLSRMKKTRSLLPGIIRPDIIKTERGFTICELDSVPGGFGTLCGLMSVYSNLGYSCVGSEALFISQFARLFPRHEGSDNAIAIIVSEESADYRPELLYFAEAARKHGYNIHTVSPKEVIFQENGLFISSDESGLTKLAGVYRFFELFDLDNIPKSELVAYSMKKSKVNITPPYKHFLEEKMLTALFHHPVLFKHWKNELTPEGYDFLKDFFPESWIMDPAPLPPHALIPGLFSGDTPVSDWNSLKNASKKQRTMIIKISGFSENAWGSRGVYAGHDMSSQQWAGVIDTALENFHKNPYILQKFVKSEKVPMHYFSENGEETVQETGRVRLSPYYLVDNNEAVLCGILATICPPDKVMLHGMSHAVMVPCTVQ